MDRLQHISRLLHTALLLTSYTIQELGSDLAAATPSDHSGTGAWVGENLNLAAKAVANKKPRSFETGLLKIKNVNQLLS
jgi:DNA mismatch repair protein MutH